MIATAAMSLGSVSVILDALRPRQRSGEADIDLASSA